MFLFSCAFKSASVLKVIIVSAFKQSSPLFFSAFTVYYVPHPGRRNMKDSRDGRFRRAVFYAGANIRIPHRHDYQFPPVFKIVLNFLKLADVPP